MAATTMSVNPQKITVSGTGESTIDFDKFAGVKKGEDGDIERVELLLELVSGASVQISSVDTITSDSAAITTASPRMIVHAIKGNTFKYKGGAGSEVFTISVCPIVF